MSDQQLTVSTRVALSPADAWTLYTDPQAITQWNFANDDWCCPSASVDLRVGGAHAARMEAKDGSFGFDLTGTYSEVDAPHALTLVLADGRVARTTFEDNGDGTTVTTRFDPEATNPVAMQRDGWQAILENYRRHAEQVSGN